jgi:hypothetical protein
MAEKKKFAAAGPSHVPKRPAMSRFEKFVVGDALCRFREFRSLPVLENRFRPSFGDFESYESGRQENRKIVPD